MSNYVTYIIYSESISVCRAEVLGSISQLGPHKGHNSMHSHHGSQIRIKWRGLCQEGYLVAKSNAHISLRINISLMVGHHRRMLHLSFYWHAEMSLYLAYLMFLEDFIYITFYLLDSPEHHLNCLCCSNTF